ncbi:DUF3375 domain-containing protein [Serratia fonticola]|uniref:DUF3375 domain-containing protein n=1 Tax=Serratia fonticola TaxID=47917 RepID=A0AAW3WL93_SERFO|nr:DUF3375 domain-containing protein [Serratia fonticola]NYA12283.1 DUF3375 domain-containing protein [Serratia fonticola]NYA31862.1 DUF3375 domain-containing protein [Serratia fonticola]
MSFYEFQARFRRIYQENIAWKLLRTDNAPLILAFVADLFSEENEVPYGRARILLESILEQCRLQGIWITESPATSYLNQWIQAGWLRELDGQLTKTDACETALRFSLSLDQHNATTTASHLRIVQDAVRDFVISIFPNPDRRLAVLEQKRREIQREIDAVKAGVIVELSPSQQRERLREIYQLASVLTGDFRRVEDEIRTMDKDIRIQMIEQGSSRGEVLLAVLEKEQLLTETDAGSAFEGFFQLLCDQNRTTEFREQLQVILNLPVAESLTAQQKQFLGQLMRELSRESERVFLIRRKTEESLRAYIESGTLSEQRAVDRLLGRLERLAIRFKEDQNSLKISTSVRLPTGHIRFYSPDALLLKSPDEQLDTSGVEVQTNGNIPSDDMLDYLDTVSMLEVAQCLLDILQRGGPMTLAALAQHQPLEMGLEELVAWLRVAKAVKATELDEKETIMVTDKQGVQLNAVIPGYLLSAAMFPANLGELAL